MPVPVTAYRCQWKCGRTATTVRKSMEAHEARCLHNPAVRACPSCRHDLGWASIDPEIGETPYTECAVQACPEETQCVLGCPQWAPKQGGEPCCGSATESTTACPPAAGTPATPGRAS